MRTSIVKDFVELLRRSETRGDLATDLAISVLYTVWTKILKLF